MKKIGILTLHYADGYGACLQAYALRRVINSFPGCSAEIINYVPSAFKYPVYEESDIGYEKMVAKRTKFEHFLSTQCGIKENIQNSVDGTGYDIVCAGSDQIWNLSWDVSEYFLPHVKNKKKISYAASFGINQNSIFWNDQIYSKYLSEFDAISLREAKEQKKTEELSGKACEVVLDPTLLLDAEDYECICNDKNTKEDFIFLFWIKHDNNFLQGIEFANKLSRNLGIGIIHSFADNPKGIIYNDMGTMIYKGIEDFLYYIKNASYVVTNSYHASLFSIQFGTRFYTFNVDSMRDRIETLQTQELFNLSGNIISNFEDWNEINYENVVEKNTETFLLTKNKSVRYLMKELEISE